MPLKLHFTYAVTEDGADKSMWIEAAPAMAAAVPETVRLSARYPAAYSDEKMLQIAGETLADMVAEHGVAHDPEMTFTRTDGTVHALKIILS